MFSLNPSFPNLIPLLLIMPSIQPLIISLPPWCLQPPDTCRLLSCPLCNPPAEWDVFGSAFLSLELSPCSLSPLPYHGPLLSSKLCPAPSLPVSCHEGLWLECSSRSCPCGLSLCPPGHTPVPMAWPGCHCCSSPISYIFSDPAMFSTCFAFLLPELFSDLSFIPGKRARSCFFPSSLGSRTCRAIAEIPSCHFIFLSVFFFTQRRS